MAFYKTGDSPIIAIYCSCGNKVDAPGKKCASCEKNNVEKKEKIKQDPPNPT